MAMGLDEQALSALENLLDYRSVEPVQFFRGRKRTPEQQLLLSLLLDALKCASGNGEVSCPITCKPEYRERERRDATRWFREPDSGLVSLRDVCESLSLDMEHVRSVAERVSTGGIQVMRRAA